MKVGDQLQKDGRRVSFLIPQDAAPPDLVNAPMGTKFMIAYALYTEDEIAPSTGPASSTQEKSVASVSPALPSRGQGETPKSEGERALIRCALLCKDERFLEWVDRHPLYQPGQSAAGFVRDRCGITTRSQIATDPAVMRRWLQIETAYLQATGGLAEVRG